MIQSRQVSAADMVASVVSGTAKQRQISVVRPVSYRIPINMLCRVDALAEKSGKSRNSMLNSLVEVGLEEVLTRLSPEDFHEIQSREITAIRDLMDDEELHSTEEE